MSGLWYFVLASVLIAGAFLGLRLSEIVLRREWTRLQQARKNLNDGWRDLERGWEEWRQLQDSAQW